MKEELRWYWIDKAVPVCFLLIGAFFVLFLLLVWVTIILPPELSPEPAVTPQPEKNFRPKLNDPIIIVLLPNGWPLASRF